jgi:hypothetical protein
MESFVGTWLFHTLMAIVGIALFKYIFVGKIHIPGLTELVASV